MSSPYEVLDREMFRERAERLEQLLPPTVEPPDNVYFNGDAFGWEFAVEGHRATYNFMVARARGDFPPSDENEIITFVNQAKKADLDDGINTDLIVEVIDGEGRALAQSHMRREGDRVQILKGAFRIITGDLMAQFVIEYPGEKPVIEDASTKSASGQTPQN